MTAFVGAAVAEKAQGERQVPGRSTSGNINPRSCAGLPEAQEAVTPRCGVVEMKEEEEEENGQGHGRGGGRFTSGWGTRDGGEGKQEERQRRSSLAPGGADLAGAGTAAGGAPKDVVKTQQPSLGTSPAEKHVLNGDDGSEQINGRNAAAALSAADGLPPRPINRLALVPPVALSSDGPSSTDSGAPRGILNSTRAHTATASAAASLAPKARVVRRWSVGPAGEGREEEGMRKRRPVIISFGASSDDESSEEDNSS